jgi:hypothetical protein
MVVESFFSPKFFRLANLTSFPYQRDLTITD